MKSIFVRTNEGPKTITGTDYELTNVGQAMAKAGYGDKTRYEAIVDGAPRTFEQSIADGAVIDVKVTKTAGA